MKAVAREKVRVGVVGCGVVAGYGHLPSIQQSPDAELVAVVDPDEGRRQREAAKYQVPGFESFERMLEQVELDAVSIPTHPAIRPALLDLAAEAGLHAFCEKPLTEDPAEAERVVANMESRGLQVAIAFIYRGKEVIQRMLTLMKEGAIGRVRAVLIENLWDYHGLRDDAERPGRRRNALRNLGTLDCGVHDLDLACYLAGADFARIQAMGTTVEPENPYPDHILVQAEMTNGVLATIEESAVWGHTAKDRPIYCQNYRVLGEQGYLAAEFGDFSQKGNGTLRVVSGERQWNEPVTAGKGWQIAYDQFFRMLKGETIANRVVATGRDAVRNMQAAAEVIRQCRQGSS